MKKKVLSIIICSMVTILLFAGCENINNESLQNEKSAEIVIEDEIQVKEDNIANAMKSSNNGNKTTENSATETDDIETIRVESIEGIYIGQIDNMSIEVKELPSGDVAAYNFSEQLRYNIKNNLSRGNTVIYSYFMNSKGKRVITEIEKKYYFNRYDNGKYVGQIDGNSIEIIDIDTNKKIDCRIADEVKYAVENQLKDNEIVQYKYYLNKYDQRVIVYIEGKDIREYAHSTNGVYQGLIDGTSIEILDSNTGKKDAYKITEEQKEYIQSSIKIGDKIGYTYIKNDLEQFVIRTINASNELKVKYIGMADGTSIEIQYLDTGKYERFRLDEETMKSILTIKDGSEITIQYYINDLNQKVITIIS